MKLEFSLLAQQDMREIAAYLRKNFLDKGMATRRAIVDACKMLFSSPLAGRMGNEPNTREYLMPRLPYRIIYQFTADCIIVLRVYHTSRRPL